MSDDLDDPDVPLVTDGFKKLWKKCFAVAGKKVYPVQLDPASSAEVKIDDVAYVFLSWRSREEIPWVGDTLDGGDDTRPSMGYMHVRRLVGWLKDRRYFYLKAWGRLQPTDNVGPIVRGTVKVALDRDLFLAGLGPKLRARVLQSMNKCSRPG